MWLGRRISGHNSQVVVPRALREDVLRALHQAHQGSTSMALRAGNTVWWPEICGALNWVCEGNGQCRRNAPSQPATPPVILRMPDYPFQLVATDYFAYGGNPIW